MDGLLSGKLLSQNAISGEPIYNNKLYLYNEGDECSAISGGWSHCWDSTYKNGFVTKQAASIEYGDASTSYGNPHLFAQNMIDLTAYTKLSMLVDIYGVVAGYAAAKPYAGITIKDTMQTYNTTWVGSVIGSANGARLDTGYTVSNYLLELDVSSINVSACILAYGYSHSVGGDKISIRLKKYWLE